MLSIRGTGSHGRLGSPTVRRDTPERRIIRTLATKCWHNGRSLSDRAQWRPRWGGAEPEEHLGEKGETYAGEIDVTGYYLNLQRITRFQRDVPSGLSFSGNVTGGSGWSTRHRFR